MAMSEVQISAQVWVMIKMGLTPMTTTKQGRTWVVMALKGISMKAHNPKPLATDKMTRNTPLRPKPARDFTGLSNRNRVKPIYTN